MYFTAQDAREKTKNKQLVLEQKVLNRVVSIIDNHVTEACLNGNFNCVYMTEAYIETHEFMSLVKKELEKREFVVEISSPSSPKITLNISWELK